MTSARITQRRGFTLRELTLAMAVGSVVMMTAVGLVHHAFDWSKTARHRRADDQTFFLLSGQLRSDVSVATKAEIEQEADLARLTLSTPENHQVVYETTADGLSRIESRGAETLRREQYRFRSKRQFELISIETENQIRLDVRTQTPFPEAETPLWRSIRMTTGLRLRHQRGDIES